MTKRDTKSAKRTKKPSPKEHARATLKRWEAVTAEMTKPSTPSCGTRELPLTAMLSMASDFPMRAMPDSIEAMATAFGMIEMADRIGEIENAVWPLEMGKSVATAWLVSQRQYPPMNRWPVMLISRCLRGGPEGWASAFNDVFGDCEGLDSLEEMCGITRRTAKAVA